MQRRMTKKDRVNLILKRLNELYPSPGIPLSHRDPYTLLVAVVLSAQTTDKKVNEVTTMLFDVAPDPIAMVNIGEANIFQHIKQLGLAKTKANHIYRLSEILIKSYTCEVPKTFEELENLPGVGHKTASVVMAQAFGIPTFPVDTHIHRLAQRWCLTNGKSVKQTERDLKNLFPIHSWNTLHLQFIFYGREFCTARGCNGTTCNLCQELFPNRKGPVRIIKA